MNKRDLVSYLIIGGGVIMLAYPFIVKSNTINEQNKLMKEYEQILFEFNNNMEEDVAYNNSHDIKVYSNKDIDFRNEYEETQEEVKVDAKVMIDNLIKVTKDSQQNGTKAQEADEYLSRQEIIGLVEIDKLNLKMIIVEGTEWDNIRVTIGHMSQTKDFGEVGNCAIAGHRGGKYGIFFKHIDELVNGDEIKITDLEGNIYLYRVYKQFVTEPTDMSVINDIEGEKTLTLISCENNGEDRLIVYAKMD